MPVITVRGQFGSGAVEIGRLVAEKIGGDYVDREIIAHVAERLDLAHEHVVAREEPPGSIWGRIAHALEQSMGYYGGSIEHMYAPAWQVPLGDTHYLEALTSVIMELAEDPAIVIRGRGSQFILKDHPTAFHVLTVAPLEVRIIRVMETMKLSREAAEKEIDRFDNSRRTFIKRYFDADLEDPVHYHLTINTWHLSYEAAAQIVVDGASLRH